MKWKIKWTRELGWEKFLIWFVVVVGAILIIIGLGK